MADQLVTIVPKKGVKLPVSDCVLKKDDGVTLTVVASAKTGRGRGVKHVLRQFVISKENVAYLYAEKEITAEQAEKYPAAGAVSTRAAPAKAPAAGKRGPGRPKKAAATSDAPKKRGRPKGSTNKKAAAASGDAAPKKRGRPKGSTNKKASAGKRGPGRPKKAAAASGDAPKKRGRPKGSTNKKGVTKKKGAKATPAAKGRGSSLFDDF